MHSPTTCDPTNACRLGLPHGIKSIQQNSTLSTFNIHTIMQKILHCHEPLQQTPAAFQIIDQQDCMQDLSYSHFPQAKIKLS